MPEPISTPAQMREAAALAVANIEIGYHDGIGGDWHPYNGLHIISAACAAIRALPVADPLCTWPSCGHTAKGQCNPTFALPVAEQQATRDRALDDAARAASDRATYWWDEATAADDAGRKKLSMIYEAKALACTELAAAIRAMKGKP